MARDGELSTLGFSFRLALTLSHLTRLGLLLLRDLETFFEILLKRIQVLSDLRRRGVLRCHLLKLDGGNEVVNFGLDLVDPEAVVFDLRFVAFEYGVRFEFFEIRLMDDEIAREDSGLFF